MFCSSCGKSLEGARGNFCSNCGKNIERRTETTDGAAVHITPGLKVEPTGGTPIHITPGSKVEFTGDATITITPVGDEHSGKEAKTLFRSGITEICIGAFITLIGLWLSDQIGRYGVAYSAPSVIVNGSFVFWFIAVGVMSVAVGCLCLVFRKDPKKYNMLLGGYIILLIFDTVFVVFAGIPVASFVGGFTWVLVVSPIAYLLDVLKVAGLRKKKFKNA